MWSQTSQHSISLSSKGIRRLDPIPLTDGFLTSKDRFVERKEAGEIAFKAGQIKELTGHLYSEDIY